MAITSESQILNATSVKNSCYNITSVISCLRAAKTSLSNAKKYVSKDVFQTNEGNTFPTSIDNLITDINNTIENLSSLSNDIQIAAISYEKAEEKQYQEYLDEQERIRQEEELARLAASDNQNAENGSLAQGALDVNSPSYYDDISARQSNVKYETKDSTSRYSSRQAVK